MKKVRKSKLKKKGIITNSPLKIIRSLIAKGEAIDALMIFLQVADKLTPKKFSELKPMIMVVVISYLKKGKIKELIIKGDVNKAMMALIKDRGELTNPDFEELDNLITRNGRWATTKNGSSSFKVNIYSRRSANGAR